MVRLLTRELDIPSGRVVSFEEWMEAVTSLSEEGNPAKKLVDFLGKEFNKMSCGEVILDTSASRNISPTMRKLGPIGDEQVRAYLRYWRSTAVLQ